MTKLVTFNLLDTTFTYTTFTYTTFTAGWSEAEPQFRKQRREDSDMGFTLRSFFDFRYLTSSFIILMTMLALRPNYGLLVSLRILFGFNK